MTRSDSCDTWLCSSGRAVAGELPLAPFVPYTLLLLLPPPELEIGEREFGVVLDEDP